MSEVSREGKARERRALTCSGPGARRRRRRASVGSAWGGRLDSLALGVRLAEACSEALVELCIELYIGERGHAWGRRQRPDSQRYANTHRESMSIAGDIDEVRGVPDAAVDL
jgi:hypothetical protein